jgi:hypothetical protein
VNTIIETKLQNLLDMLEKQRFILERMEYIAGELQKELKGNDAVA